MQFMMISLITYGLSVVTASVSAIMFYISIPVSYLLDIFFMGKQIGALEIIGAIMIIASNVSIGLLKANKCIS